MENKDIIRLLRKTASLMEINDVNEFKVRAINNAIFNLERVQGRLEDMSAEELQGLKGIGKSIAEQIAELIAENESDELRKLMETTPRGVTELLNISGVGAKKIRLLWKEEGIASPADLRKAIQEGRLLHLKGFGEKTISQISESLEFYLENQHKMLLSEAMRLSESLMEAFRKLPSNPRIEESGALRRRDQIIEELTYIAERTSGLSDQLKALDILQYDIERSSPYNWRGIHKESGMHVRIRLTSPELFAITQLRLTGPPEHTAQLALASEAGYTAFKRESEIYERAGFTFIPADVRVAENVLKANAERIDSLITPGDIRGILHAHSTYSDGQQSLEEMVDACREQGFEYLGITDHSKSSFFYANGLFENRIREQFEEISRIQAKLDDFRIFRGIECDILSDGSLDYTNDVLQEFDFIIISVHSVLHMDMKTATARLVKAIENPYSTILGHLTGRLLLRRQGYPLHMPTILDACRDNGVSIEINANPRRLDIDWTHLPEVLERGIKISINPDAHSIRGFGDISYGVLTARKGLVTPADNLTSLSADDLQSFFAARKKESVTS